MQMKRFATIAALGAGMLTATGCSQRVIDFTVISSKNVDMRFEEGGQGADRVEGKDEVVVFLFPLGSPNLKEAVDKAIESAGPGYDALIDGVVTAYNHSFLFGVFGYRVEGTPVKTALLTADLDRDGIHDDRGTPVFYHSSTGISNPQTHEPMRAERRDPVPTDSAPPIGD